MASLPGDLREDLFIQLHLEDVVGLIDNGYLRMSLLNFILHLTCRSTHSPQTDEYNYCLGGMIMRQLLEQMLMPYKGIKKQEKFMKLCKQLDGFDKSKHQVVVPDIDRSHYSVINILIDNDTPNYITKVLHYNSLVQSCGNLHFQPFGQ